MGKSKKKKNQISPQEEKKAQGWVLGVCIGLLLIAILMIVGFSLAS